MLLVLLGLATKRLAYPRADLLCEPLLLHLRDDLVFPAADEGIALACRW